MNKTTLRNIAIVVGVILFVPAFVISPPFAVILVVIVVGAWYVATQIVGNSEVSVKKEGKTDRLYKMWIPVRDEMSEVVRMGGKVTSSFSVWTAVPNLYKQETPATFHQGMERYVNKRAEVAALVVGKTSTEEMWQQQEMDQQELLFMSRELLEEARKGVKFLSGSEQTVGSERASRAVAKAQPTRAAATRPSAASGVGRQRSSAVSRAAQARPSTTTRTTPTRPAPSRPAPSTMRSAVESPAPAPPRITAAPEPPGPVVAAPAPREPEPRPEPAAAPVSTPGVASEPEVMEETKSPEPVAGAPPPEPAVVASTPSVPEPAAIPGEPAIVASAPSVPEPAATPTEPTGDLSLDVASVCEELFNPKIMSYEANRLFDDRYKDATVRWTGTMRRASTYSYDFNFGDGGGTKAEFDVYEVKQQYGSRAVRAFVQLPTEAADDIGGRIGEEMQFEGRLMTCEGSARRLYVADAHLVG